MFRTWNRCIRRGWNHGTDDRYVALAMHKEVKYIPMQPTNDVISSLYRDVVINRDVAKKNPLLNSIKSPVWSRALDFKYTERKLKVRKKEGFLLLFSILLFLFLFLFYFSIPLVRIWVMARKGVEFEIRLCLDSFRCSKQQIFGKKNNELII